MNSRTALTSLAFLAGASSVATAQLAEVMICDEINEVIYRCSDLNGDGDYLDTDEMTLLVDFGSIGSINPYSVEVRAEGPTPVAYVLSDSMPDGVYRGADNNLDGTISSTEMTVFFDWQAIYGAGADPHGVTLTADGAVWVSSSFESTRGLWRLVDLNADGDAMDAGEFSQLLDGSATAPVETDLGVVMVEIKDLRFLARDGNGVVGYSGFSTSSADSEDSIFRFEDLNLDGDVTDPGESKLLLNYTGKNPALPVNPDFGTVLPTMEVPNTTTPSEPNYGRLWHVETMQGGATQYFFGCDSSSTSTFSSSVTGDFINGLVFRGVDGNGDGDVNDAGEVNVYYDGSADGPLPGVDRIDKIVGMGAEGNTLYLADASGARIIAMEDGNADGDVLDAGEVTPDLWTFGSWGSVPPVIDPLGPFITDIEAGPNGLFPAGAANWTTTGVACSQFSPGPPAIGHTGHAQVGTSNFSLTLSNTGANLPAIFGYGLSNTDFMGIPLPLDLTPLGYSGCFLYQNLVGQSSSVFTDGAGAAAVPIPIPNDQALVNLPVYLQWVVIDIFSGGIAVSNLGTVIIEQ